MTEAKPPSRKKFVEIFEDIDRLQNEIRLELIKLRDTCRELEEVGKALEEFRQELREGPAKD